MELNKLYYITGSGNEMYVLLEIKNDSGFFQNVGWASLKQVRLVPKKDILERIDKLEKQLAFLKQYS